MKIKIALLSGGISGEKEVSINTGNQIFDALDKNKYEIFRYDPKTDLKKFISDALNKKFDLVFPALHGPFGEDGKLQGLMDVLGIPYLFSQCLASALAMDKYKTKIIVEKIGIDVAPSIKIKKNDENNLEKIISELSFPIVIKPIELGSSVGMSIAKNREELEEGIEKAFQYDKNVLLEKFIKGREITVAIIENEQKTKILPVIEIIPKVSGWFDYKAKYEEGGSDEICPAKIPEKTKEKVQILAKKIFEEIGCKDLARADFIWEEGSDTIYFLEINTIPGMTKTSLVPKAAKADGMEFGDFLDKLINNALK